MPKSDSPATNHYKGKAKAVSQIRASRKRTVASSSGHQVADYSVRSNPLIYVQQLESTPLSDIRNEPISHKRRHTRIASSFHEVGVSAPVPSKRLRHQARHSAEAQDSSTLQEQQLPPEPLVPPTTAKQRSKQHTASTSTSNTAANTADTGRHRQRGEYAYQRDALAIPLAQDAPIPNHAVPSNKDKEKEFWRRQRRTFVRSRYITNEEAVAVANTVFTDHPVAINNRNVVSCQGNIANFRSKWRKLLKDQAHRLYVPKAQVTEASAAQLEHSVRPKVDQDVVEAVWGYWVSLPYVDAKEFYATQTEQVQVLTDTTVKALCIALQLKHGLIKEREFRKLLDDLDKYTRRLALC